ncbi:acylneuraminate cytidylyltransferase [Photobacterium damselae subsp. damselae]|uniref:cytidylyltransferase domain-containing protein n=1 Tax=Photobacterium damselae TaxID=38293 RepID=UPI0010FF1DC2|nr:GDSL-type esterase/lipase family protein [Photobacterium damselae]TLS80848.1 acylneuraminate cytidylyltransferase [Photobacterium damselae subsp. damselae]TLS87221.1 acylneuraminate cytidylyltransferase [Photobacterium damselae subsp. damselae]
MTLKKIAIIPARSGSKGLPNKNILMLLDKPLIAYTIEAAKQSGIFERVIVSTDSLEYKNIAEQYGAEVILRDEKLASDTATSFMVIEDVLNKVSGYDYFVLLQPTSPFRNSEHIQQAIKQFELQPQMNFLISVCESNKSADLIKPIDEDLSLKNFDLDFSNYRRQNSKEYTANGAIFIGKNQAYLNKKHFFGADSLAFIMNKTDSVDIDDKLDFELAICLQTQKNKKQILRNAIHNRITEKKEQMNLASDITLIGHSIFDYWDIEKLNNKTVNNLGIAGISSQEYLDFILNQGLLCEIGDTVLLFAGTNDIVIDGWQPKDSVKWISQIYQCLITLNPNAQIKLLSVPPVRGRIDRSNSLIKELNQYLRKSVIDMPQLTWIELSSYFYDEFGNLPTDFTYDGLHFSEKAYQQLELELSKVLS